MVRFASTIHILSHRTFKAECDRLRMAHGAEKKYDSYDPWTFKQGVVLQPYGYTDWAQTCSIVNLRAPNAKQPTGSLFHLDPDRVMNWQGKRGVRTHVKRLKQLGVTVRALLTGGKPMFDGSRSFGNALYKALMKAKIPTSVIWGQTGYYANMDALFSADEDTVYLSPLACRMTGKEVLTAQHLKDAFHNIRIAPGDTLLVDGTPVAPEAVEHWDSHKGLAVDVPTSVTRYFPWFSGSIGD